MGGDLRRRIHCSGRHRDLVDVRFRSRTAEHVTGGFYSFMQVGAVRPQHTHASFHGESRLPEHSLREGLAPPIARMAMQRFQGPRLPPY